MGLCFSDCEPHNDYHHSNNHYHHRSCETHVREQYRYGDSVCSDDVCSDDVCNDSSSGAPPVYICDSPRLQYYQNPGNYHAGFTVYEEDSGYAEAFLSSGVPEYQEPPPPAYSPNSSTNLSAPPPAYNPAYLKTKSK